MKLRSKRSKEAAEGGNETAQNCRYPRAFSSAKRYRNRRHEQCNPRRHSSQPSCKTGKISCKHSAKFYLIVQTCKITLPDKAAQRVWLREDEGGEGGNYNYILYEYVTSRVLLNNATFQILIATGMQVPSTYLPICNYFHINFMEKYPYDGGSLLTEFLLSFYGERQWHVVDRQPRRRYNSRVSLAIYPVIKKGKSRMAIPKKISIFVTRVVYW